MVKVRAIAVAFAISLNLIAPVRADDALQTAYARIQSSLVLIGAFKGKAIVATGSGFVVGLRNRHALIVRNRHVIASADSYIAVTQYPTSVVFTLRILKFGEPDDLALLEVDHGSLPAVRFATGLPQLGHRIAVVGYPRTQIKLARRRTREAYADLVPIMKRLSESGDCLREIEAKLDDLGHRTPGGGRWISTTVHHLLKREALIQLRSRPRVRPPVAPAVQKIGVIAAGRLRTEKAHKAYAKLLPFVSSFYGKGLSSREITDALNKRGERTQQGNNWSVATLRAFLRREGPLFQRTDEAVSRLRSENLE